MPSPLDTSTITARIATATAAIDDIAAAIATYATNSASADAKAYHLRKSAQDARRALGELAESLIRNDYSA